MSIRDLCTQEYGRSNSSCGTTQIVAAHKARGTIRKLLRGYIRYFKHRLRFSEQLMRNLSKRITPSKPFNSVGIDFCGPIYVHERSRKNSKNVKTVFVCLATKTIHLKMEISNLTTDAFLNAFKRFIGRRGKLSDVSDNGTNLAQIMN